jgi:carbonic anhydrase
MTRTSDDARPDVTELFDDHPGDELVCRVCGAMVPRRDDYARVHWDWHEAANGA